MRLVIAGQVHAGSLSGIRQYRDILSHKVQDPEQKDNQEFRYDAREKGNNSYNGSGKKKKKHGQSEEDEGSVHVKERRTSFDVKI